MVQSGQDDLPDDEELKVLWKLHEHPDATVKQISDDVGMSEHKVKHCLDAMRGKGWIRVGRFVDVAKLGFPERYRVDISVDPRRLKQKGEGGLPKDAKAEINNQRDLAFYIFREVAKLDQFHRRILIEDIRILLGGPADLSAIIRATDNRTMLEFITDGLRTCGAVANTSTCLEQWSIQEGEF